MRSYAARLGEDPSSGAWRAAPRTGTGRSTHAREPSPDGVPACASSAVPSPSCRRSSPTTRPARVAAVSRLDFGLRACDEITGLVIAAALVRPTRTCATSRCARSRKRWKEKASRPASIAPRWSARRRTSRGSHSAAPSPARAHRQVLSRCRGGRGARPRRPARPSGMRRGLALVALAACAAARVGSPGAPARPLAGRYVRIEESSVGTSPAPSRRRRARRRTGEERDPGRGRRHGPRPDRGRAPPPVRPGGRFAFERFPVTGLVDTIRPRLITCRTPAPRR